MVVAVAKAAEAGARAIVCASTGNTSASAAAYGAAAGHGGRSSSCRKGQIATGKLLQALDRRGARRRHRRQLRPGARHRPGARRAGRPSGDPGQLGQPVPPRGPEDRARSRSATTSAARRTSWPSRSATPATSAPTGRASATYAAAGRSTARRRGCGASRRPARRRSSAAVRVDHPETIATAIRIGDPASWDAGDRGARRVGRPDRRGHRRRDPRRLPRRSPRLEGIFCEPASAASVAGVRKAAAAGELDPDALVVCVLTGHGLKDPTTAERQVAAVHRGRADRRRGRRRAGLVGAMVAHWLAELDGRTVTVEVPASSANLGAGYDCLGVALALTNRIELEVRGWSRGEIELTVEGEGRNELTEDRDNRFVRGLEAALERGPRRAARRASAGGSSMHNQIPLARGLGSSAAATVGRAWWPATRSLGDPLTQRRPAPARDRDRGAPRQRRRGAARRVRGQRADADDGVEAIRFDAPRDLRAVLFIPELRLSTDRDARRRCPTKVPLADAVANLGARRGWASPASRAGRYDLLRLPDRRPAPRAVPRGGLPAAAAAGRGRARGRRARRVPVGRRLDDPRLRRLDGRHHPHRGAPSRRPPRTRTCPAGSRSSSRATRARRVVDAGLRSLGSAGAGQLGPGDRLRGTARGGDAALVVGRDAGPRR